ncbi:dihydrolipoyl dehydrogenase [Lactonifactor longoviformis]|uniref:dihydrolipoyl dehydrogenase n=1 Tax=Lactonifactor longoviformis TaxID=341220 RepID=UPI00210C4BED|nr:dihydrolipoyl dehydrogenase [Lactonifactor longoviformis]MCQ4670353.1 dihydrolipoyl dehydrogenase [Lactonifactor longoviformis]
MDKKTVTVIGGGPGGYVAAIRAAQLGAEVTLIEKKRMGGTCLNIGCIPTKALLDSAHVYHQAGASAGIGVVASPHLDWDMVQERRKSVIDRLVSGVEGLMRSNRIRVLYGSAGFLDPHTVCVNMADGQKQRVSSDFFILATGAEPLVPPIPGAGGDICIDSAAALSLEKVPDSMLIVGGGVIGVELATAYHEFGTKITIVEMAGNILPNMDRTLSEKLKADMEHRGIRIMTGAKVCKFEKKGDMAACCVEQENTQITLEAEKILLCIGRKASLEGLNLEKAGVRAERRILTDSFMRTSAKHIYAVGDCNGQLMLAHAASEQGMIAAENCMGGSRSFDGSICPGGVYSFPELAGVGFTEEQLREKDISYRAGVFPMAANGRALIYRQDTGMVKVLTGEPYGELLGVHIYGAQATELIAEAALAIKLEATADELIDTIHAHPTLSECVREAALAAQNRAIHTGNKKTRG